MTLCDAVPGAEHNENVSAGGDVPAGEGLKYTRVSFVYGLVNR